MQSRQRELRDRRIACTHGAYSRNCVVLRLRNVSIRLKRVYDKPANTDGHRVLVDRLWPRGLTKSEAQIDEWFKEIAPSAALRKWYKHEPDKWKEFKKKYAAELDEHCEQLEKLAGEARTRTVTFLFSAKDIERNNAVALREYIEKLL